MSSSSMPLKQTFQLKLENLSPDAKLTVYDGRDRVCFQSTGESAVVVRLPKGLYSIRGELAGVMRETPVRVDQDATLVNSEQLQIIPPQYTAAPLKGTALSHEYYRYPSHEWSLKDTCPLLGTPNTADSSFFVFIRPRDDSDEVKSLDQLFRLHLLDASGTVVASFSENVVKIDEKAGWMAFSARAPHGYYSLEYYGIPSRAIALYLFPGWQTQIFLMSHGRMLLFEGARIFLSRLGVGFNPERDDLTVATDLGLDYLQNDVNRLPKEVLQELLVGKFENPMMGLVAAHVLLKQGKLNSDLLKIVIGNLGSLLGECPDVSAIQLLYAMRRQEKVNESPFEHPPMFRAGLEAVVRASFDHVELLPEGGEIETISPFKLADSPWSSWEIELDSQLSFSSALLKPVGEFVPFEYIKQAHIEGTETDSGSASADSRLPLDWIQTAFLDTVTARIRSSQMAAKMGLGRKETFERAPEPASGGKPTTKSLAGINIDLRDFACDLGMPLRTVLASVEPLASHPISADELLKFRATAETQSEGRGWLKNYRADNRSAQFFPKNVMREESES
jgi:hypothetical protein